MDELGHIHVLYRAKWIPLAIMTCTILQMTGVLNQYPRLPAKIYGDGQREMARKNEWRLAENYIVLRKIVNIISVSNLARAADRTAC